MCVGVQGQGRKDRLNEAVLLKRDIEYRQDSHIGGFYKQREQAQKLTYLKIHIPSFAKM